MGIGLLAICLLTSVQKDLNSWNFSGNVASYRKIYKKWMEQKSEMFLQLISLQNCGETGWKVERLKFRLLKIWRFDCTCILITRTCRRSTWLFSIFSDYPGVMKYKFVASCQFEKWKTQTGNALYQRSSKKLYYYWYEPSCAHAYGLLLTSSTQNLRPKNFQLQNRLVFPISHYIARPIRV